jgi:hypothetical protein
LIGWELFQLLFLKHNIFYQVADEVDDLDLGLKKKKKKAKDTEEDGEGISSVRATTGSFAAPTDLGPNDIYPYAQILQRIYDALSEKNPELMGGKKFTMIPPQVRLLSIIRHLNRLFLYSGCQRGFEENSFRQLQGCLQAHASHHGARYVLLQC